MARPLTCPNGHSWEPSQDPLPGADAAVACPTCGTKMDLGASPTAPPERGEPARDLPPSMPTTQHEGSDAVTLPPQAGAPARADFPAQLGRYRLERKLGEGGMGSVYLAHDALLDRRVAVKIPRPGSQDDPEVLARLQVEARAAARLHHPNLCPIFDVGEVDGIRYLTMPYIEGRSLAQVIEAEQRLAQDRAVDLVRRLALALDEAHRQGVIHRDLKPSNIIIDAQGEPVILDFGLARRVNVEDPQLTRVGAILGTPAYMSPEQARGDTAAIGPATDVYGLGVILYELLTGRRPFGGSVAELLGQILYVNPEPPTVHRPGLDVRLSQICLKALAKNAASRFSTMREMSAALADFILDSSTPPTAPPMTGQKRALAKKILPSPQAPLRRHWILVAGTGKTELPVEVVQASSSVGALLAQEDYGLVVGGWPGVDYITAASFAQQLSSQGYAPIARAIKQVVPQGRCPDYRDGEVIAVPAGESEYTTSVCLADAVILIGGLGGTLQVAQWAWSVAKPVFPIPWTGGDADRAFRQALENWNEYAPRGISAEEYRLLTNPSTAEPHLLRKLLRAALMARG